MTRVIGAGLTRMTWGRARGLIAHFAWLAVRARGGQALRGSGQALGPAPMGNGALLAGLGTGFSVELAEFGYEV